MKVTVKKKSSAIAVPITTEFIKLEAAMKLSNAISSGGTAKNVIQDGLVTVDGEVCAMRGKKLYPGNRFSFDGVTYEIVDAAL